MSQLELIATATFGLESLVADELRKLGYGDTQVENGKVTFTGDELALCRANLWLRTAARVKVKVGEFKATTFDELFEKTKALPWAKFLPKNAEFPVEGRSVQSTLFSVSDCQAIVKKAVVESLKQDYKLEWFPEDGPLMKIEVALLKDVATLTIDTTGSGLHQRGYRALATGAPLKETLAAALVILARWYPDIALIDPFCGSGTIPIEAALIGHNIAPGLKRSFAAEDWPWISPSFWKQVREEAQ
ncbi:MAG: class I SAM-dependent RNA methyltransferase, partial [Firmicutes bacterium]|nr:class I SAM-dependent RNA methyltransferase [Bacillota bacterium]